MNKRQLKKHNKKIFNSNVKLITDSINSIFVSVSSYSTKEAGLVASILALGLIRKSIK